MSVPARKLDAAPARAPHAPQVTSPDRARPTRTPAARPQTSSPPSPRRRARRGPTPAFWVLAAVVVGGMVVGIVSVSALLVQGSFRVDELNGRISALQEEREVLTEDVAELSSPTRVQVWARQAGLVMPENVVVLRVPPVSTSSPGDAQG